MGTQTVTLSFAVSDFGTAKWETSLNGHYRARGASVVQSEPFNWQKSLALEKNVNEVVGMWLCLRMWLFYLNFLTSFNLAIRVWGFSSGFPHSRGPAWALSANEGLSRAPCVRHSRTMNIFLMAFTGTALPQAALLGHGYCFTEGKTGSQLWKT